MKIKKCYLNENGKKLYKELSNNCVPINYSTVLVQIANIAVSCVLLYLFYAGFASHNATKAIVYLYTMYNVGLTTFIVLMIAIFIAILHKEQDKLSKIDFLKKNKFCITKTCFKKIQ